jgi:hypothetical protein
MAHAEHAAPPKPIDASFIDRSFVGLGALNAGKGFMWGSLFGVSQSLGAFAKVDFFPCVCLCLQFFPPFVATAGAFFELSREAKAKKVALDLDAMKRLWGQKMTLIVPSVIA